jgi:hypothetical protein
MVEGLWGGKLPDFSSIDEANELIGALITGLWNRLARHRERSAPFRLTVPDVGVTREGLATLALIRRQEPTVSLMGCLVRKKPWTSPSGRITVSTSSASAM